MSNTAAGPEPVLRASASPSKSTRLIHAAALAALLVPLGSVAVESSTITCGTSANSGSCSGLGFYNTGSGEQSNTWKFFDGSALLYTLQIAGTPTQNFSLDVNDLVTTQGSLEDGQALINFPGATCIPTFDANQCGLFQVFEIEGTAAWLDGYILTITWFANNNPLSQPPDDGFNTILQAKNASGGIFGNELADIDYDPSPSPTDPGISGRGDAFSTFGAFRIVPEPATLVLFGMGAAGVFRRARRGTSRR